MPTIDEAAKIDWTRFSVANRSEIAKSPPVMDLEPTFNRYIRCPLPQVNSTPDSLRQFYIGNQVPQMRIISPPTMLGSTSGGSIVQNTIINTGSSSGGSNIITEKTASITSSVLNTDEGFQGSVLLSRSYQLLGISSDAICRVRLYGNSLAQILDESRDSDTSPVAGSSDGLLIDVVLDTAPFQLLLQNISGANSDNPQTQVTYVTITNTDVSSNSIGVTLIYVPLET